ncbi:MAG: DNA methyltransferase [Pseudomonadota bacterium]
MHSTPIIMQPVSALSPAPRNARTHSPKQIRQIAASIERFGFINPVLIDAAGQIIAGHGRVAAAKQLGLADVPTLRIDHLSDDEKRAYVIADNRLAELAGWDMEILSVELADLGSLDLDFNIELTGFDTPEIDNLFSPAEAADDTEDLPEIDPDADPITAPGDLWQLGRHWLYCGDALEAQSYDVLLHGAMADMVITDPPYNVPIDGHVCGLGQIKHQDFAMASGEMSEAEFTRFLTQICKAMAQHSKAGALQYIFMDWRHMAELLAAGQAAYGDLINLCVWNKANGGMGSLYRSKHELVFVFKNGLNDPKAKHINNVALGKHGRNRTNVWDYAGVNSLREGRLDELAMHPTVKPTQLIADAILDASPRNGHVLDPFAGSGSTILAADRTGRTAYAMELSPLYVDVAIKRFEAATGISAVHAASGLCFAEL